jgi:hypothetical protein
MMNILRRLSIRQLCFIVSLLAAIGLGGLFAVQRVYATHGSWHPSVPDDVEHVYINTCPPSGSPGQTIHAVYPNPSTIPASSSRTGTTNLYATSLICATAPYTFVGNVVTTVTNIVPNGTSATMSIGSLPSSFTVGDLNGRPVFGNPVGKTASLTNLQDGWNCWTVYFYAAATHGGSRITSAVGTWGVCVYFAGVPADNGSCSVISKSPTGNLNPGQSFSATFHVNNTGGYNWPTGGRPFVSSLANRYRLGSQSSTNWGKTRVELPGEATGFGPIIYPGGWASNFTESGFTAPATAGTYSFTWQIVREGVYWLGPTCTMSITVINLPALTCSSILATPFTPSPGQAFTVRVGFSNAAGAAAYSGAGQLHITDMGGLTMADVTSKAYTPVPVNGGGTGTATFNNWTGSAGNYTIRFELTGSETYNNVKNCPGTIRIANKPYFRVFGDDLIVGMSAGCSSWMGSPASAVYLNAASIFAWNQGSTIYGGAGAQLAVQTLGTISSASGLGFVSSARRGVAPVKPIGLTFANSSGTYGGSFGAAPCPTDYYGSNTGSVVNGPVDLTAAFASSGLGSTTNITGKKKVYINGNLSITNNVTYSSSGWSSVSDIPSLYVIVKGNIYIQPGVTQLDGIYIAQPTTVPTATIGAATTAGYIYTCANGYNAPSDASGFWSSTSQCGQRLVLNGSVISLALRLYRTNGSLFTATGGEGPDANQAETFQYSPEVWLAPCNVGDCTPAADAYQSLPPVL